MKKYVMLMIAPFLASNLVSAHDITFYKLHPVYLQKALEQCPRVHPEGVTCEQLNDVAVRANQLVSELQQSPQLFGQKILALQEQQAKLKADLSVGSHADDIQASLEENKMQLRERLAIVQWLESPRG